MFNALIPLRCISNIELNLNSQFISFPVIDYQGVHRNNNNNITIFNIFVSLNVNYLSIQFICFCFNYITQFECYIIPINVFVCVLLITASFVRLRIICYYLLVVSVNEKIS